MVASVHRLGGRYRRFQQAQQNQHYLWAETDKTPVNCEMLTKGILNSLLLLCSIMNYSLCNFQV